MTDAHSLDQREDDAATPWRQPAIHDGNVAGEQAGAGHWFRPVSCRNHWLIAL
jgi:hypothetical protein